MQVYIHLLGWAFKGEEMKMSRRCKFTFYILLSVAAIAGAVWFMQGHNIAVLDTKGIIAFKQKQLLVVTTLIMLIVVVPALFMTFFFAWKYREENTKAKYTPDHDNDVLAEAVWWTLPTIIILVLSVLTWKSCYDLDPFKPIDSSVKPMRVQVVALQWKWLFIYPEQKIASLNRVQIPVNTPIRFEITSDAPMNSFWIPELGGQIYAMAGMNSELQLMADQLGSFRGSSANLSGDGFASMWFTTVASTQEDFDRWAELVKSSPKHLDWETYEGLVKPSIDEPVAVYALESDDLYNQILMKYMTMGD